MAKTVYNKQYFRWAGPTACRHGEAVSTVRFGWVQTAGKMPTPPVKVIKRRRSLGLSLVEMLISLAVTAMLLTATMVAIDASFKAYAAAAESASTQTSTRLVTYRLLSLMRTSTAHGPLQPTTGVTLSGTTLTSKYIELLDPDGNLVRLDYDSADEMLYVTVTPFRASTATRQPLLGGVTQCEFKLIRRLDKDGVWILERGTINFTVEPDEDASLAIEGDAAAPIRVVASTMPRKLEGL